MWAHSSIFSNPKQVKLIGWFVLLTLVRRWVVYLQPTLVTQMQIQTNIYAGFKQNHCCLFEKEHPTNVQDSRWYQQSPINIYKLTSARLYIWSEIGSYVWRRTTTDPSMIRNRRVSGVSSLQACTSIRSPKVIWWNNILTRSTFRSTEVKGV